MGNVLRLFLIFMLTSAISAQSFTWITSTEGNTWQQSNLALQNKQKDAQITLALFGLCRLHFYSSFTPV